MNFNLLILKLFFFSLAKKGRRAAKSTPVKQEEPKDQYEFSESTEENSVGYQATSTLCYMPRLKDDRHEEYRTRQSQVIFFCLIKSKEYFKYMFKKGILISKREHLYLVHKKYFELVCLIEFAIFFRSQLHFNILSPSPSFQIN